MEKNGGMVAVVQGLKDSSLTVTLLDGGKQYTLMPNNHVPQPNTAHMRCHPAVNSSSQYTADECSGSSVARNRENGIQATDGRYASTYKMMHCNVSPTSPPPTVTEFPPQKSEVVHGHGNFVVGGYGSGETARPTVKTNSFRGGMVWPDKGSVCASRASMQSDAFANSLRKYPNITPERSSEIVQRLISFTQAKNLSKLHNRCPCSPTRNSMDSEASKQTFILERNSSKNSVTSRMIYQPEVNVASKKYRVSDNSPVRERSNNFLLDDDGTLDRPTYCKSNDVRCFRDTARQLKQGFKSIVSSPNQYNKRSSSMIRQQYDEFYQRRMYEERHNSVNMEIQAAAQKESKEILTLPRIVPVQRTIATPLSPIPSKIEATVDQAMKPALRPTTEIFNAYSSKSIQVKIPLGAHIKTTSSSIDVRKKTHKNKTNKRSRSEEELVTIKKNKSDSIYSILQDFNIHNNVNEIFREVKRPVRKKKRICQNCKHLFDELDTLRRSASSNTYFHDDFQFNINEQETSKHFIEMSRNYHIDGCNRDKIKNQKLQLQNQPEFLSYVDTRNNIRMSDVDSKRGVEFTKASDSYNIRHDEDNPDIINEFPVRERCQGHCDHHIFSGNRDEVSENNKMLAMTHEEVRNLIDLDILSFSEKYGINITTESLCDLNEKLFELLMINLNNNSFFNKKHMTDKINEVLQNRGLSELQSIYLTNILIEHWEEEFLTINNNLGFNSSNFKSKTLIILPNITQDSSQYTHNENNTDINHNEISRKDVEADVNIYIGQISNEIDQWLSSLHISEIQNNEIRQAIINDLATDIVDRHKYLELNPPSEISDTSELEHLKYQIFKLIYKLGVIDMTLVDSAIDLMKRIQNVDIPRFTVREGKIGTRKRSSHEQSFQRLNVIEPSNLGASSSRYIGPGNECCKRPTCQRNLKKKDMSESNSGTNISVKQPEGRYQATTSTRRMSSSGKLTSTMTEYNNMRQLHTPETNVSIKQQQSSTKYIPPNNRDFFSGGIRIKDDENDINNNYKNTQIEPKDVSEINKAYNQYVKEWVESLPLQVRNAEEETVAKIARTDIYNGILETVTKLRSERDTFNNRFLFEDKLDDEVEKLMSNLPQSPELKSMKHILKIKLIEKTSNTNDLIKSSASSYKQQLVENLKVSLPKLTSSETENPDILELYEELQILNLVEDFIICSHYQNENPVVAEAYRNKLKKHTEDFVQELKANHGKALKNIDTKIYLKDILDILENIPMPSDDTIHEEADQILLSIEIDKWFTDLPLIQDNDFLEQLHRRRLRNNLAKQIIDIEKNTKNTDRFLDNSLKHEISQFLGKAPLQQGESLNINLMVDELIKRLKKRPMLEDNDNKKVAFNEPDYEDFSKNLPLCSTYTDGFGNNIEVQNKSALTKSIQTFDPSHQLHSGHYHNISKPLLDDLRTDQSCCSTNLSLREIPKYDTFDNTRPRSSSLKDDSDPRWYTLQESGSEYRKSNTALNTRNQNTTNQSHKSIQAISPSEQSHNRHYHNIAQPLLDDLRSESNCCNDEPMHNSKFDRTIPRKLLNGSSESNWYTLHESKQEYSQLKFPNRRASQQLKDERRQFDPTEQYMPDQEFIVPQHYVDNTDRNDYLVQKRQDVSHENLRNSPKRVNGEASIRKGNKDIEVEESNYLPANVSTKRHNSPRFHQETSRLDQRAIPHRIPYYPSSPKEANISNRSSRHQDTTDERRGSPHMNRSDLFYRSTDQEGIRQTIERNKSFEANLNKCTSPHHIPEYYQPPVFIPAGYVPVRFDTKKGYVTDRNIDERYQEEADTDEEIDDEEEVRCRCVEKMWKNKRKYRYCPFEQYEGFPMCMTSPYFYPYFY